MPHPSDRDDPPSRDRWLRARAVRIALLVALAAAGGCATSTVVAPYVAVREAQFRTEEAVGDRITLPLDAAGRARVLRYLRAGGNTQNYGVSVADPNADRRYAGLLDWLSRDHTLDDLAGAEGKPWFTAGPVFQIVDARERHALSDTQVAAMSDGVFWWVFYHPRSRHLDQLLITPVVGAKPRAD